MVTINENKKEFIKYVDPLIKKFKNKKIIIADGDETISVKDTSKIFFDINDCMYMWDELRKIFKDKGRNHKGYLDVAKVYSKIPYDKYQMHCENTLGKIKFRDFWYEILKLKIDIIVVTSGLDLLWNRLMVKNKWNNVTVIGGNNFNEKKFIVTPEMKKLLVKKLKKQGNKVISFGDSRVDRHLLRNADIGCIVTNERKSPGLAEELKENKHIIQLSMDEELSELLPVKKIEEIIKMINNL